jgi:hypothetical protein
MKTNIEDHKKRRADMQRKMREENASHQSEKMKLQHSELQSRRREQNAQRSILKLETQIGTYCSIVYDNFVEETFRVL